MTCEKGSIPLPDWSHLASDMTVTQYQAQIQPRRFSFSELCHRAKLHCIGTAIEHKKPKYSFQNMSCFLFFNMKLHNVAKCLSLSCSVLVLLLQQK